MAVVIGLVALLQEQSGAAVFYIAALALFVLLLAAGAAAYAAFRASGGRAATGLEGMVGKRGVVRRRVDGSAEGAVFVHGELWRAVPEEGVPPLAPGARVEVTGFRGMTLVVRPADEEDRVSPP